jgi:hypothetical protein
MALRRERGARHGRAARRGAGAAALLATALFLAGGLASTWPALRDADDAFLAQGLPGRGEAAPGDHLQTAYNLWLPGHQLVRGGAPWLDPYSFQPEAPRRTNFAAWPYGAVWWPLDAALSTVGAWNAFVLLGYVAAGLAAWLWLRSLALGEGAALVGGLAFALAPYRVAQEAMGHLLAWVAAFLAVALWGIERRRPWLAAAALASIPLSGQVHLALGAIPFALVYALVRARRVDSLAVVPAVAAGILVWAVAIRDSVGETRSFAQVERYSAQLADLVSREPRDELESFVLLGWVTPVVALVGLGLLVRARRYELASVLGLGALLPALLSLGGNLPGYRQLWELPGLHATRVPARLLPIGCLALAALLAFAVARLPARAAVTAAALLVIAIDLRLGVEPFRATAADPDNRAYAAIAGPGRLLDVPVFLPDRQEGSVYAYYAIQAPRERPSGYSTSAPQEADTYLRALGATCAAGRDSLRDLRGDGVRFVVLHGGLFAPDCEARAVEALRASRFREVARDAEVRLFRAGGPGGGA